MPNMMKALKDEITRLARREVKGPVAKLHTITGQLRRDVAALKRTVAQMARNNKGISAVVNRIEQAVPVNGPETPEKARVTGKGIRSLRRKLGLSQSDFGRLIGVTGQSVANMERKNGKLAVRTVTRAAILAIRGMGAREAKARLGEMPAEKKMGKGRGKKKA